MFIQTESTPNPATLKFLPGREVMGEGAVADFPDRDGSGPLAPGRGLVRDPGRCPRFLRRRFHLGDQGRWRVGTI